MIEFHYAQSYLLNQKKKKTRKEVFFFVPLFIQTFNNNDITSHHETKEKFL